MTCVVILGRPNVGKTALFNALTGQRAVVHKQAGVTRDWREAKARLNHLEFTLIDTAGVIEKAGEMAEKLNEVTKEILNRADVILLIADGKEGILPADRDLAKLAQRSGKPVIFVLNKADDKRAEEHIADTYTLGLGEPVMISAAHRQGFDELGEKLALYGEMEEQEDEQGVLSLAILGRPNAGKSTLVNTLLGEQRMLAGEEAGLTRESVSSIWEHKGKKYRIVDTPGLRKKAKVSKGLEKMSVGTALRAAEKADVVILMVDVESFDPACGKTEILEQQDTKIASYVIEMGKPLIIALNKWDANQYKEEALAEIPYQLQKKLAQLKGVPVCPISAKTGKGCDHLLKAVEEYYTKWQSEIGTSRLNKFLEAALDEKRPPLVDGKPIKLKYMTQLDTRPPTFAVWGTRVNHLPGSYKRFLLNKLRHSFDLEGIPIRLVVKAGSNPYS